MTHIDGGGRHSRVSPTQAMLVFLSMRGPKGHDCDIEVSDKRKLLM
jgi:hypothetical protein